MGKSFLVLFFKKERAYFNKLVRRAPQHAAHAPCRNPADGERKDLAPSVPSDARRLRSRHSAPSRSAESARAGGVIARSRSTLATIDAAAIEKQSASPPTTHCTLQHNAGGLLPSTRATSGGMRSRSTARAIASMVACRMLSLAISATDAAPTPMSALAHARSAVNAASRWAAVSFFESSSSSARFAGTPAVKTTAAATTGPAKGPRPASSTPATRPPQLRLDRIIRHGGTIAARGRRATDARCVGRSAWRWLRPRSGGDKDADHARNRAGKSVRLWR